MKYAKQKNHLLCGWSDKKVIQIFTFPIYIKVVQAIIYERKGDRSMAQKANSLAHTKWMCKYHIVFTPKYRRKVIYNQLRKDIGEILRTLCRYKGVEIIEGHLMSDHVHMLVMIPPKESVSKFMGYLKGKSALMIFDRHANLKYKYGDRHFWARGYYVDTVGRNKKQIAEYIKHQLTEDQIADQISLKEFVDPFTGSKNTKA